MRVRHRATRRARTTITLKARGSEASKLIEAWLNFDEPALVELDEETREIIQFQPLCISVPSEIGDVDTGSLSDLLYSCYSTTPESHHHRAHL